MNKKNEKLTSFRCEPCVASAEDVGVYTCYVTRVTNKNLTSYWKYYLEESADDLYRIRGWERAEKNDSES